MKRIFLISIVFFTLQVFAFAQTENSPCPKITVQAPEIVIQVETGEPMFFKALIDGKSEEEKFEYGWTVTAGKIGGGQGTPILELDVRNMETQNIIAAVEVKGLPENCAKTASDTGAVMKREPHNCLDTYGKVSWREEYSEIDNVMVRLRLVSGSSVIFYLSFRGKPAQRQSDARILRMLKAFALRKRLDELKNRIAFVVVEDKEKYTRICYFSETREKIDFNDSSVIKGADVDLKKLSKTKKPKK